MCDEKTTLGRAPDPVAVLRAHRASVNAVAFHSTTLLLSGDAEGEFRIWDVNRRRTVSLSRAHSPNAGVIGIGTSELLGNKILSQGRDGTVKCWQLLDSSLSREPLATISTNAYHFCKISPLTTSTAPAVTELRQDQENLNLNHEQSLPAGKRLVAIAGEDPSVAEVWDIDGGERVLQLRLPPGCKSPGMCMALQLFVPPSLDGAPNVLAGYEDGSMSLWDLRSFKSPRFSTRFHSEPVLSLALDATCQGGLTGSADDKTVFFRIDSNENSFVTMKEMKHERPGVGDVSVRPDGRIAAAGGWDYRVRVYDYRRQRALGILKYHSSSVNGVCFSKDSSLLASASQDACIALWSIYKTNAGK